MQIQPPIDPLPNEEIDALKLRSEMLKAGYPFCYYHKVTRQPIHCKTCVQTYKSSPHRLLAKTTP